ncbi:menaquinol-cytochrome c reductase cytochrome b/c subunit [Halobacillus karajensis]|uniref:Cytochrome b n=1 Tax=Halobacillus karajensis TaxID=195088 RepID=A0A024P141_9BACI|nr:menaquinol-cytochrome c reductase cytochrome b/c subunit [Halobacillus karajensis]CDQ19512.1 Cytochrome b [Halobacillus karajensis]CDQ21974.1 Cytochrome b [Halobacillus karajensis]CDQ27815.1 Cytochrome b [Halobacillus karajensis]SEH81127.1 menaquinol-cytochrome c reductase cytochrome b/c subunit [Halobacillus karajensis]
MHRGKGMKFVGDSRITAERKANLPKDYSEYPGRTEAFWPNFLLKEWLVGAVFLIGFLILTAAHPSPLEQQADPNNASYIPLPDWYFLFLYQFLKYQFAGGDYIVLGAIVMPGLAFGALLLAPFLDRGPERRPHKRPIAVGLMLLGFIATFWLTYESVTHADYETRAEKYGVNVEAVESTIDKEDPGYAVYEANCLSCHGDALQGQGNYPSLIDAELSVDQVKEIAVNGIGEMPSGIFGGSDEELQQLAEFVVNAGGGDAGGGEGEASSEEGSSGEEGSDGESEEASDESEETKSEE